MKSKIKLIGLIIAIIFGVVINYINIHFSTSSFDLMKYFYKLLICIGGGAYIGYLISKYIE
jgi:hypothetical protein